MDKEAWDKVVAVSGHGWGTGHDRGMVGAIIFMIPKNFITLGDKIQKRSK